MRALFDPDLSPSAFELQGGRPSVSTEQLARAEERRRLGQTLHDGTGQMLALGLIRLDQLSGRLAGQPGQREVDELRGLLQQTLEEVRALAHDLRPPTLRCLGLRAALAELASCARSDALQVELRVPDELPPVREEIALAVYRIAQAALGNVVLHARASRCQVALSADRGCVALEVTDDGVGFDALARTSGIGLYGMRDRTTSLGGSLQIASRRGRSRVRAEIPLT